MVYANLAEIESRFPAFDPQELVQKIRQQGWMCLDIETSRATKNEYPENVYKPGLDPFTSKIVMLQVGLGEDEYITDVRRCGIEWILPLLEDESILKIGQNLKFECKFFLVHYDTRIINLWDTMIAEMILYNGLGYSYTLEALSKRYLNKKSANSLNLFNTEYDRKVTSAYRMKKDLAFFAGDDTDDEDLYQEALEEVTSDYIDKTTRMGFVNMADRPFTVKEINYGAEDVRGPIQIWRKQKYGREVDGEEWCPTMAFRAENALVSVLAEIECCGMTVDPIKWLAVYEENLDVYQYRKGILDSYVESHYLNFCNGMDLFSETPTCGIHWGSSKQVIKFFKHLDICPQEFSPSTKRKEYSVGAKVMFRQLPNELKEKFYRQDFPERITNTDELTLAYLLFKKSEQLVTTFGKDWLKFIHPITKKVHANYRQYLISNRMATTGPNVNQIPGTKPFRGCFTAALYKVLNSDYSTQEIRVAAEVHDVPLMIKFFTEPNEFQGDFHAFGATNMFRAIKGDPNYKVPPKEINGEKNPAFKGEHSEQRSTSKNITFKVNYGGSEHTLSLDLGIDIDDAKFFLDSFFNGFPGLRASHNAKKKEAVQKGWIEFDTYLGKRYFYPQHAEMQAVFQEAQALKPDNWWDLSKEDREELKAELRETTNWSELWRTYSRLRSKLERRALNLPIQGSSGSMTKLALLFIHRWIRDRWSFKESLKNAYVDLSMHDEIGGQATEEFTEEFAKVIEDSMMKAGRLMFKRVPMTSSCAIVDYWCH